MTINNKNKTEKLFPLLLIVILPDDDTSSVSKACNKKMNFLYIYVGYLGSGFAYFRLGFAQKGDQRRSKMDQDRTRRALSNALFTYSPTLSQTPEKSKILSKNNEKNNTHLVKPTTIRPLRGPKSQTYIDR